MEEVQQVTIGPDGAGRPDVSSLILGDSATRQQLTTVLAEMLRAVLVYPTPESDKEDTAENGVPAPLAAGLGKGISDRQD